MRKFFRLVALIYALGLIGFVNANAQTPQIIKIPKGQTRDVWFGANVTGKVHLAIRTRDGRNKMNMWWLTWGVGSTTNLGELGPNSNLDIPITWWKGVVSAKLRGTAADDTVVYVSDKVAIDYSKTFTW